MGFMNTVRLRGEGVRRFIVEHIEKHPLDIAKIVSEKFDISRQAANKHLQNLVLEGALIPSGQTRNRNYRLAPLLSWKKTYKIKSGITEDQAWKDDIASSLGQMPKNVTDIWHYGFTEMFNNAIDHSGGKTLEVHFKKTAVNTEVLIIDDGVGIFKKIQAALGLLDERHSVLELAKGKLTTDPARHSGEGIFFTSRMFDDYWILSGDVYFSHEFGKKEDWILETHKSTKGTMVCMKLNNHTARTSKKVFDQFTSDEDYGFNKTIVPVKLTKYGDDNLVSRSQAKRLLSRVEKFKTVIFDFRDVDAIGQAFADEVFRVFAIQHPTIEIIDIHANSTVGEMISRARSNLKSYKASL
jgi:anti-sigma regulatory factor (Ser/Thr protein kinase)